MLNSNAGIWISGSLYHNPGNVYHTLQRIDLDLDFWISACVIIKEMYITPFRELDLTIREGVFFAIPGGGVAEGNERAIQFFLSLQ